MVYLDGEELLVIHARVIEATGGSHGVRDVGLLASILKAPKSSFGGTSLYPDRWEKGAVYMERLAKFHVFVHGNKRTALVATARFLFLNGYHLVATNREAETFTLSIVTKKLDAPTIAAWLKRHSRRIRG